MMLTYEPYKHVIFLVKYYLTPANQKIIQDFLDDKDYDLKDYEDWCFMDVYNTIFKDRRRDWSRVATVSNHLSLLY